MVQQTGRVSGRRTDVKLCDGSCDVGSVAAYVHRNCSTCCNDNTGDFQSNGIDPIENRETLLQENSTLHQNEIPQPPDISRTGVGPGGCPLADAANKIASGAIPGEKGEKSNLVALYDGSSLLQPVVHAANESAPIGEYE